MTRYVGLTPEDRRLLQSIGPLMDRHLPAMTERLYAQIARHHNAAKVMTGGGAQIDHLKESLQGSARKLFTGPFNESYASERHKIGVRHVAVGVPQRYVISSTGCSATTSIRPWPPS